MSLGVFGPVLFNPILNAPQDVSPVVLHIAVREPQNPETTRISFASLVSFEFVAITVAINLNYQSQLATQKSTMSL